MEQPEPCNAPDCERPPVLTFFGTPLCREHGIAANRRARLNVLLFGVGFAVPGLTLTCANRPGLPLFVAGAFLTVVGSVLVAVAAYFKRAADRLDET